MSMVVLFLFVVMVRFSSMDKFDFDPVRDICAVDQFGFVDLVKANLTGSVPASIEADDIRFNGMEDPAAIGGRPSDAFEAAQAARVITGYKAPEEKHED